MVGRYAGDKRPVIVFAWIVNFPNSTKSSAERRAVFLPHRYLCLYGHLSLRR